MSYARPDRRKLETLITRAAHLSGRIEEHPEYKYDLAELAALGWAIRVIIAARGPLPEDLERMRRDIWPEHRAEG